ncbi:MAG: branched-chain amino acid ABC transporter permease [Acidimicrobiia bacterium]|nr:branched-chain amino acid ABC transporter permease [Acidimicrobiia bacterium]
MKRQRVLIVLAVIVGLVLVIVTPASAQDEPLTGPGLQGTVKAGTEPIEGVEFEVSQDGEVIGTDTTDAEGTWGVAVPVEGVYQVTIDIDTLPEGITLRNADGSTIDREVVGGRPAAVIFALQGEGTGPAVAPDPTWKRLLNRGMIAITFGLLLAMAAVGLSLVFGVTGLVNFAHSEMVAFGAIITFALESALPFPLPVIALLGFGAGGLLGFTVEKGVFAPLRARKLNNISLMVVSIGLAFVMRHLYLIYFGSEPRFFEGFGNQSSFSIGPISRPPKDYWITGISFLVLLGVGLLLQKTKLGTSMRAVSDSRDLAESSGINVKNTILWTWIAGSALAALGGVFLGLTQRIEWQMGERQLLLIFAAVTLGGLGSAYGAMVGGLAIGFASELSTFWLDNELKFLIALAALVIILLVRPQGILGVRERLG